MKELHEINRDEKLAILKGLKNGSIKKEDITPDVRIITHKDDTWILMMINASRLEEGIEQLHAIALKPELQTYLANFKKRMTELSENRNTDV